jgi:hypothetical protein
VLSAILVAGFGRSGTTALMSLLAGSARVTLDNVYPFEKRHLTYLAKLALLLEKQNIATAVTPHQLCDFGDTVLGASPYASSQFVPTASQWLRGLWEAFSIRAVSQAAGAGFYAEKAPYWLSALARECLAAPTIYLFRDPRDIFLSASAFMNKRGSLGFDRSPGDTDRDYARTIAQRFLSYFENYRADRHRPDCMMVKYEDMVASTDDLLVCLDRQFGIGCGWEQSPWLEAHRTTADLHSSVVRWRREPLPAGVDGVLRDCLGPAMAQLGYLGSAADYQSIGIEFHRGAGNPAHIACNGGELVAEDEFSSAVIASGDFWMIPPLDRFDAVAVHEIWVCLRGAVGDVCSVYWRTESEDFAEARSVHTSYIGGLHWQVLRISVGNHPLWKGTIAQLRLDLFNWKAGSPNRPETGFIRWLRLVS